MNVDDDRILKVAERIPTTIPDVIRQQADLHDLLIADAIRPGGVSGVVYFNYLYKIITESVLEALEAGEFDHPDFLITLDVEFAKRYFAAIGTWIRDPKNAPRVWRSMFDQGYNPKISAIQFAMAGVNAHVNFDLAFSVVNTFTALDLDFDEKYRGDYRFINDIFHEKIPELRVHLQDDFWNTVDRLMGEVDDWLDDIVVIASREWAWYSARRIWPDRNDPVEMAKEGRRLDRFAAMFGRGILMRGLK